MWDTSTVLKYKNYIEETFLTADSVRDHIEGQISNLKLPNLLLDKKVVRLVEILLLINQSVNILEIGTYLGYSSIKMASASSSQAKITTIEINPQYAQIALENFSYFKVDNKINLISGSACSYMNNLSSQQLGLYDFVLVDANNNYYLDYLKAVKPLVKPKGLIVADNTMKRVLSDQQWPINRFNQEISKDKDFVSLGIPVFKDDFIDGITVAYKKL